MILVFPVPAFPLRCSSVGVKVRATISLSLLHEILVCARRALKSSRYPGATSVLLGVSGCLKSWFHRSLPLFSFLFELAHFTCSLSRARRISTASQLTLWIWKAKSNTAVLASLNKSLGEDKHFYLVEIHLLTDPSLSVNRCLRASLQCLSAQKSTTRPATCLPFWYLYISSHECQSSVLRSRVHAAVRHVRPVHFHLHFFRPIIVMCNDFVNHYFRWEPVAANSSWYISQGVNE